MERVTYSVRNLAWYGRGRSVPTSVTSLHSPRNVLRLLHEPCMKAQPGYMKRGTWGYRRLWQCLIHPWQFVHRSRGANMDANVAFISSDYISRGRCGKKQYKERE